MLSACKVPYTAGIWFLRFGLDPRRRSFPRPLSSPPHSTSSPHRPPLPCPPLPSLLPIGNTRGEVSIWSVDRLHAKPLATLKMPSRGKKRVASGPAAASASATSTIAVARRTMRHAAVSHDCRHLVGSADDGSLCVWPLSESLLAAAGILGGGAGGASSGP